MRSKQQCYAKCDRKCETMVAVAGEWQNYVFSTAWTGLDLWPADYKMVWEHGAWTSWWSDECEQGWRKRQGWGQRKRKEQRQGQDTLAWQKKRLWKLQWIQPVFRFQRKRLTRAKERQRTLANTQVLLYVTSVTNKDTKTTLEIAGQAKRKHVRWMRRVVRTTAHTHHSERTTRSFPNKSWERQKCSNSGTYFWSARWWTRDCREPECSCSDMWTFFHWWWWWRCCFHCEHVPEFHLLKDMVQKKKEQILGGRLFVRTVWTDEVNIILDSGSDATVFPHEFVETGKDTNNLSQLWGAQGHPRWVNTSNWILSKDWAIWDLGPASTSTRWPFVDVRAGGFVPILHRIYLLRIACPLTSRVQCVYRRKHRWLVYCNGKNSNIRNSNIV